MGKPRGILVERNQPATRIGGDGCVHQLTAGDTSVSSKENDAYCYGRDRNDAKRDSAEVQISIHKAGR